MCSHLPYGLDALVVSEKASPPNELLALYTGPAWTCAGNFFFDFTYGASVWHLNSKRTSVCRELDTQLNDRHGQTERLCTWNLHIGTPTASGHMTGGTASVRPSSELWCASSISSTTVCASLQGTDSSAPSLIAPARFLNSSM
jgi:hypothetical protein